MMIRVGCKGLICATCGFVIVPKKSTTIDKITKAVESHRKEQHDREGSDA